MTGLGGKEKPASISSSFIPFLALNQLLSPRKLLIVCDMVQETTVVQMKASIIVEMEKWCQKVLNQDKMKQNESEKE